MLPDFFKLKFGKDAKEFKSLEEIYQYVEKKIGGKLKIKRSHSDICSSRGSIIPLKKVDVERKVNAALKKR